MAEKFQISEEQARKWADRILELFDDEIPGGLYEALGDQFTGYNNEALLKSRLIELLQDMPQDELPDKAYEEDLDRNIALAAQQEWAQNAHEHDANTGVNEIPQPR